MIANAGHIFSQLTHHTCRNKLAERYLADICPANASDFFESHLHSLENSLINKKITTN